MRPIMLPALGAALVAAGCVRPWHVPPDPSPAALSHDKYAWLWWQEQADHAGAHPADRQRPQTPRPAMPTPMPPAPPPPPVPDPPGPTDHQTIADVSRTLEEVMQDLERLVEESCQVQTALLRLRLGRGPRSPGGGRG